MKGVNMKKSFMLLCIMTILLYCGPKSNKVEKITEGGKEVVLNHIEPYEIKGVSSTFSLEQEFTIDMENEDITEIGIVDIYGFDIDSEENIFIFGPPLRSDNHIFKFNKYGEFIKAFGPKGQGPGEIQFPVYLKINSKDELPIVDVYGSKLLIFNKEGEVISEIKLEQNFPIVYPLENGNYLIGRVEPDVSGEFGFQILSVHDSNFKETKEIERFRNNYPLKAKKFKLPQDIFWWTISSKGNIYIGNTERGYEISVCNLEGRLIRIIRKEFNPVPVPDEIKKDALGPFPEDHPMRKKLYFADHMPPFEFFFLDDKERLFVLTAEKEGDNRIYDIFNEEGTFIGRKALNISFNRFNRYGNQVIIRNERLVCVQEKESSFKELLIYKMTWQ